MISGMRALRRSGYARGSSPELLYVLAGTTLSVYDARSWGRVLLRTDNTEGVALQVSEDGTFLNVTHESEAHILNANDLTPLKTISIHTAFEASAFHEGLGIWAVTWFGTTPGNYSQIRELGGSYDALDNGVFPTRQGASQKNLDFRPGGDRLASSGDGQFDTSRWSRVGPGFTNTTGGMTSVRYSPDGTYIARSGNQSLLPDRSGLKLYEVGNNQLVHEFPGRAAKGVAFSPDGSLVAYGYEQDNNGHLRIYDPDSGDLVFSQTYSGAGAVTAVEFNSDGSLLAVGRETNSPLLVLNTADWSPVAGTPVVNAPVRKLAFAPNPYNH